MRQIVHRPSAPPESEEESAGFARGELAELLGKISKTHGDDLVRVAAHRSAIPVIPSGVFLLDLALNGGIPQGMISCLFGWEASGKSTLAMKIVASAQRIYPDKAAVYIDTEGTYDPVWGEKLGIDNERLLLVNPTNAEQAIDLSCAFVQAAETSILVMDSLAALVPMAEQTKSVEDAVVGTQARLIGRWLRVVNAAMIAERRRGHWVTVLAINQWRMKVGVMMGDPRVLPGGLAQNYFYATKIEILCKPKTDGKTEQGVNVADWNEHTFRIKKSKLGNSLQEGEFRLIRNPSHPLGQGFVDDGDSIVTYARKYGLVTGGGSAWRIQGVDEKFSKLADMVAYLYANPDFKESFVKRIIDRHRKAMGLPPLWGEG